MDSVHIREGRKEEIQYIKTEYDLLDELNRIGGCETLGYYSTIRRFINRKDNTKENQITYSQQYLASKMRLSNRKYYENLHLLYNVGLIDIDKIATVSFFINYNNGNANPLVSKSIVFFSTHDNINFSLKNIERYIKDNYPEYPSDLINIVKVEVNTHYVIHYIPPMDVYEKNNYKLVEYRRWDIDMAKFRRGKGKEETNTTVNETDASISEENDDAIPPSFQDEKAVSSPNEKVALSHGEKAVSSPGEKVNINNKLTNRRIKLANRKIKSINISIHKTKGKESNMNDEQMDDINSILTSVLDNLYMLKSEFPYDTDLVDEMEMNIREMSILKFITVSDNEIPKDMIITSLGKLTYWHLRDVLTRFKVITPSIKIENHKSYLQSMIYNSTFSLNAKAKNEASYDIRNKY